MTHDDMITVIEHHKKGGILESRTRHRGGGWNVTSIPIWDFHHYEYRPKKEPVVLWGVVLQGGSVSSTNFRSREAAEDYTKGMFPGRVFKMVEVEG